LHHDDLLRRLSFPELLYRLARQRSRLDLFLAGIRRDHDPVAHFAVDLDWDKKAPKGLFTPGVSLGTPDKTAFATEDGGEDSARSEVLLCAFI
jgi:hypothetical protein